MMLLDALSASPSFFISAALVLGLLVGSFLNVVIYRVPVMLEREWRQQCAQLANPDAAATPPEPRFNLVVPRSTCPKCNAPITALQNIPVISYLFLRGRCARCHTRISVRYPLIEALTGVLSALVAWKFGYGAPVLAALVLTWFLIALTFIDVDTQLLPDSMTLPLVWLGVASSAFLARNPQGFLPVTLHDSIVGAMAGYLSLWSIYHVFKLLTGKDGMGYGDFKLLAAIGAFLGWRMLLPTVLGAAAVGAVIGAVILSMKGKGRSVPIAFGPFLAASGWIMLMWGRDLLEGYLGLFGLHS
ncbi:MAG TPA: A24 family peptidase [Steroidobacteraceae bacterium]|jgi:leader peptidase (prepilin peptidase)/N-methyltransferase|nr:A24 family peptidase [Steroidobacteraceae bacterium]